MNRLRCHIRNVLRDTPRLAWERSEGGSFTPLSLSFGGETSSAGARHSNTIQDNKVKSPFNNFTVTVCSSGLLVGHQHGGKLLQLVAPDDAVQVHLLQDAVGGQLLAPLVLEQRGQHPRPLLPWGGGRT